MNRNVRELRRAKSVTVDRLDYEQRVFLGVCIGMAFDSRDVALLHSRSPEFVSSGMGLHL